MRRRAPSPLILPPLAILLGALAAPWILPHLAPPTPLDPARWTVIVPGREEGLADSNLSNGTGLVDGVLLISQRSFGRSDLLTPRDAPPIGALTLRLAPKSAPVYLNCRGIDGRITRIGEFGPSQWRPQERDGWTPYLTDQTISVRFYDHKIWVDNKPQAISEPGTIEILPAGTVAALQSIRLEDLQQKVWIEENFSSVTPGLSERFLVAMGAGLVGAFLAVFLENGGSALLGLLLLFPALGVMAVPYPEWRAWTERLYLVYTAPGFFRLLSFVIGWIPLVTAAIWSTGVLPVESTGTKPDRRLWILVVLLNFIACRDLIWLEKLWWIPGFFWLGLPYWLATQVGQPMGAVFRRDLPSLALVTVLGWGPGLLPATCWRLLGFFADTPLFLERNPRAGTNSFLVLMVSLLMGVESGLRSSYLGESWDPVTLAGASVGEGDRPFSLFWSSVCGIAPPRAVIYAFGGSSTGGAYQFTGDPSAFFVSQLHKKRCDEGNGETFTYNYGDSGRDSWDIAHAAPELFAKERPSLVLYYGGVNDILTEDAPLTRKQRAAVIASRSASLSWLDQIGTSFRTLTGLGLLFRPAEVTQKRVIAVPLEDAEENLRSLAASTASAGGTLLLVPEYAEAHVADRLAAYWKMEERLAQELPKVAYYDLYGGLSSVTEKESLLVDRNHLSRSGGETVATLLLPVVDQILERP